MKRSRNTYFLSLKLFSKNSFFRKKAKYDWKWSGSCSFRRLYQSFFRSIYFVEKLLWRTFQIPRKVPAIKYFLILMAPFFERLFYCCYYPLTSLQSKTKGKSLFQVLTWMKHSETLWRSIKQINKHWSQYERTLLHYLFVGCIFDFHDFEMPLCKAGSKKENEFTSIRGQIFSPANNQKFVCFSSRHCAKLSFNQVH